MGSYGTKTKLHTTRKHEWNLYQHSVIPKTHTSKTGFEALKWLVGQVLLARTCHPCYSGGRDQRDHIRSQFLRPYLEKTHDNKRAGGVTQGVGPEFKPQYRREKKNW
jgi:hypothetical protein